LYRANGFRDVKVTSEVLFADHGKPHNVGGGRGKSRSGGSFRGRNWN